MIKKLKVHHKNSKGHVLIELPRSCLKHLDIVDEHFDTVQFVKYCLNPNRHNQLSGHQQQAHNIAPEHMSDFERRNFWMQMIYGKKGIQTKGRCI